VTLVDVQADPIVPVTPTGVRTKSAEHRLDVLALATGFDAHDRALLRIDITGTGGETLKNRWAEGSRIYLGMAISGFPNMFLITGPGSPSVLSNMVTSIELHVDWIAKCIAYLKQNEHKAIEAEHQAEEKWVARVNEVGAVRSFRGEEFLVHRRKCARQAAGYPAISWRGGELREDL
jgi:cyclohexanone monooxygenase